MNRTHHPINGGSLLEITIKIISNKLSEMCVSEISFAIEYVSKAMNV